MIRGNVSSDGVLLVKFPGHRVPNKARDALVTQSRVEVDADSRRVRVHLKLFVKH